MLLKQTHRIIRIDVIGSIQINRIFKIIVTLIRTPNHFFLVLLIFRDRFSANGKLPNLWVCEILVFRWDLEFKFIWLCSVIHTFNSTKFTSHSAYLATFFFFHGIQLDKVCVCVRIERKLVAHKNVIQISNNRRNDYSHCRWECWRGTKLIKYTTSDQ